MSILFLILFAAMIVVYAWKSPDRVAAFAPREPGSAIPTTGPESIGMEGHEAAADYVIRMFKDSGVPVEKSGEKFHPLVVHRGLVAFPDGSVMEYLNDTWMARDASDAEYTLVTLWDAHLLRSNTAEAVAVVENEMFFEEYDDAAAVMKFKDGSQVVYNNKVHSWVLGP